MEAKNLDNLLNYYNENYEIIADFDILDKSTLGEKNEYCRFCKKSYPDVKFKDVAHAIPEALDNNKLFSYYECDECNHEFGEIIEDHLSKYLFPFRIGSIILGKKGCISYKFDDDNRLDVTDGHWDLKEANPGTIMDIIDDHTIVFKIKRQTYIPILVYKALVKVALTIIPGGNSSWLDDHCFATADSTGAVKALTTLLSYCCRSCQSSSYPLFFEDMRINLTGLRTPLPFVSPRKSSPEAV